MTFRPVQIFAVVYEIPRCVWPFYYVFYLSESLLFICQVSCVMNMEPNLNSPLEYLAIALFFISVLFNIW